MGRTVETKVSGKIKVEHKEYNGTKKSIKN